MEMIISVMILKKEKKQKNYERSLLIVIDILIC